MINALPAQMPVSTYRVLAAVVDERLRQEKRKAEGRFKFTCADDGLTDAEKVAILVEEVGEVAREVLTQGRHRLARDTQGTLEALRDELVQVAAVAIAWCEALPELREGEDA